MQRAGSVHASSTSDGAGPRHTAWCARPRAHRRLGRRQGWACSAGGPGDDRARAPHATARPRRTRADAASRRRASRVDAANRGGRKREGVGCGEPHGRPRRAACPLPRATARAGHPRTSRGSTGSGACAARRATAWTRRAAGSVVGIAASVLLVPAEGDPCGLLTAAVDVAVGDGCGPPCCARCERCWGGRTRDDDEIRQRRGRTRQAGADASSVGRGGVAALGIDGEKEVSIPVGGHGCATTAPGMRARLRRRPHTRGFVGGGAGRAGRTPSPSGRDVERPAQMASMLGGSDARDLHGRDGNERNFPNAKNCSFFRLDATVDVESTLDSISCVSFSFLDKYSATSEKINK
ncbi:unnamed protein product [Miscanthus lutarioriparius]|uniref:Uncharacterized protein n=1 Tax=Miscanthus lutarioriparius TaxID=422564 RepID=A0A811PYF1_9POAL|nr:unnamed protein product [Miscanthus lutarioriparius]